MSLFSKILGGAIFNALEHEVLAAKVDQPVFGGHAVVKEVRDHGATIEAKFGDGFDYTISIDRKQPTTP